MSKKDFFANLDAYCQEHLLLPAKNRVIIGLSGGPDSIFLLHYLAEKAHNQEIELIAGHLDHQWRSDSAKDAQFCEIEAGKLGIRCICAKVSELAMPLKFRGSKEDLGRAMRRHFLESLLVQEKADSIALAHHQQDQIETFFIRLFRGATISGLRGMRPRNGRYIRPLLPLKKADIIRYLAEHKIPFVIDPSNESPLFLRNRIRHQLMPLMHAIDNRFEANCAKAMHHIGEADDCLDFYTQELLAKIRLPQEHHPLTIAQLLSIHPYLQKRILVAWLCELAVPFEPSEAWLDEIIRFCKQKENKSHRVHPDWSIVKKEGMVYCIRTT